VHDDRRLLVHGGGRDVRHDHAPLLDHLALSAADVRALGCRQRPIALYPGDYFYRSDVGASFVHVSGSRHDEPYSPSQIRVAPSGWARGSGSGGLWAGPGQSGPKMAGLGQVEMSGCGGILGAGGLSQEINERNGSVRTHSNA
jgi:hypothetical protein